MAINPAIDVQPGHLSVACQQKQISLPIADAGLATVEAAVRTARGLVDPGAIAIHCRLDVDESGRFHFVVSWLLVPDPDSATINP